MVSRRLLLGLSLLFLATAQADTPPTPSDSAPAEKLLAPTNDVGLASDGTLKDEDSYQVRIGELRAPGGEAYILPFRLPALSPGQRIATFHLRAQLARIDHDGGGLANADLYALGMRDSEKPLPGDYYQGPKPDPRATLIQANYLTPSSPVRTNSNTGPFINTSADADAALVKYLNALCAQPGSAGKLVLLRISYDADPIPPGNNAYNLITSGADGDNEVPIFTYTFAPK
jgi:hypothetical protein